MTLYIGVDLHPHQQTAAWCDTRTGETETIDLKHDLERVREFYSGFREPAVIGIEASARHRTSPCRVRDRNKREFPADPY